MESELVVDVARMQKALFEAQKGLLEVQKGHQAQLECLYRWQQSVMQVLGCLTAIATEGEDSSRPAIDTEAMRRARAEIAELEKLFKSGPPASGDPS